MFHEFIYEFGCTKVPDACNLWLAPTIFKFSPASRRPLRQRTLPHPPADAAGLAGSSILLCFILSRVGRSVRAVPGLSPAGPVADRSSHGAPVRFGGT